MTERRKSWLALAALFLLLLVLAALRPLAVPDEGRYGEIGRWMLHSGDWLTPRLDGIAFFHKPPYLYWLEAVSLAVFGVHVWSARLVPALHAALMLLAMYLSVRQIATEEIARRTVWMLGTSLSFLIAGQYVNHDMLVAAWIGVAIWCFALAFMQSGRPSAKLARWGFVACALGVLSKGLIGVALPGLVLLIWLVWTGQLKKILYLPWVSGLALFLLIAAPWFWLAQQQFPGMLGYAFGTQQVSRFTGATFNNPQPWWFYAAALLLLLFPWLLFVPNQALAQIKSAQSATKTIAREWLLLCWIWVLAIIGFFSIPHSKIVGYALPAMPPLALLAALGWDDAMARLRLTTGTQRKLFAALCATGIAIAIAGNIAATRYTNQRGAQDVAQALEAAGAKPSDTVYLLGGYPYDLPFYRQATAPMVVIQDWPALRKSAGDSWQRELFEGADFDAQAASVLQTTEALVPARAQAGVWLVAKNDAAVGRQLDGFALQFKGAAWSLYKPAGQAVRNSTPEGPKPAE